MMSTCRVPNSLQVSSCVNFLMEIITILLFLLQIEIESTSVTRVPAEYDCCPGQIYPRLDFNFKFKYVARMDGMKMLTPESEEL